MNGSESGFNSSFRRRYIKLSSYRNYYGLLDSANAACGFCGKKIAVFAHSLPNKNEPPKQIFYGCGERCGQIPFYRVDFIDKKVLTTLKEKITTIFPPPSRLSSRKMKKVISAFEQLEHLKKKRSELSSQLPQAGANIKQLIEDIEEVDKKIEDTKQLYTAENPNPSDSPLFYPFWATDEEEQIMGLPLAYKREIFWSLITRVRLFTTYLILRTPYFRAVEEPEEREITSSTFAVNLSAHKMPSRSFKR